MNIKIFKIGILASIFIICGSLVAVEFRSPYLSEKGPLRYVFKKQNEDDYGVRVWTINYSREAHKAFMSHGVKTKPLTELFFNKSEFRLREIFEESNVPLVSEYYNPYVKVLKIKPRAEYNETGITIGARFDYPVYKNKGRIGVRVNIPFRKIEIERQDQKGRDTAQLQNLTIEERQASGSSNYQGMGYRLDFLEALPVDTIKNSMVQYGDGTSYYFSIAGQEAAIASVPTTNAQVALVSSPEEYVPRQNVGVQKSSLSSSDYFDASTSIRSLKDDASVVYWVKQSDFNVLDESYYTKAVDRLALQEDKARVWLTTLHSGINDAGDATTNVRSTAAESIKIFNENIYEWLADRGFVLEDNKRAGLGDIDLDFFYEHLFDDDVIFEGVIGVRFPTGGGSKYAGNAYRPSLGNGEHWEVKFGGMVVWQCLDWLNVKFDTYCSFVLESCEERPAAFKNAQIKNFGPRADADVNWSYLVGRLDCNLFHGETKNLSSSIGYEFYYKTSDKVGFKNTTITSWLGRQWVNNGTEGSPDMVYEDMPHELSDSLAAKNTEAIGHKLRFETSYRFSDWFELFAGGSYTVAGQNLPRELDSHAGLHVTF
jgi:hypothetical protein